jgi:hypothetical protein
VLRQPPSCKLVIVRMECTGWTDLQGFGLWGGIFLALSRLDGWVIIWSLLETFLVSFWYFLNFILPPIRFMYKGQG